jgi:hypothetical protein
LFFSHALSEFNCGFGDFQEFYDRNFFYMCVTDISRGLVIKKSKQGKEIFQNPLFLVYLDKLNV